MSNTHERSSRFGHLFVGGSIVLMLVSCRSVPQSADSLALTGVSQLSTENAYNPIPSPDGSRIAAIRTGRRAGGSGGMGRSNLLSEVIVLDTHGRTLSPRPISDKFVSEWSKDGLVLFRDWSYSLASETGAAISQGRTCSEDKIRSQDQFACVERVAYLSQRRSFVWVRQIFNAAVLVTPVGDLSPPAQPGFLGEWLAPSPDERYIAVGPARMGTVLQVYDLQTKTWFNLGPIIMHPERGWDWMEPGWSPWFPDSSKLAFFTADGLIISSPDGKSQSLVRHSGEPSGLPTPSPDGRAIAYATFSAPSWNRTGIWVVDIDKPDQPQRVAEPTPESIYGLRWLGNRHVVFDRVRKGIPPVARLWIAAVNR